MSRWAELARPPYLEGEERRRQASLLHTMLLALMVSLLVCGVMVAVTGGNPVGYGIVAGAFALTLVSFAALRAQRLTLSASVLATVPISTAIVSAVALGRPGTSVALSLMFAVVTCAVLLRGWGLLGALALSAVGLVVLAYGQDWGVLPVPMAPVEREVDLVVRFIYLGLTGLLVYYAGRNMRASLRASRVHRRALEQSEFRYRNLIENAPIGIELVDRELNVLTVNPKLVELVGAESAEELVGHNFKEFPLYQVESARSALEQCMNHGLSRAGEISYVSRWGNTMELRFSCLPTRDPDGEISGALILCQDVGERRSLEAQLRQAQKMEAVGQLAGGIAHDFNNYLTVIMGSAHELAELYSDDEQAKSVVEEIAVAAQRSASLTRQLLAFSRKQVLQPRLVDLNELITDLERMLRRVLGGNVALETRLASDLGTARVDPSQIEQVIVNLALNARDAMPRGGTLKIETGNLQLDREAVSRHPGIEPGSYVCLRVIDDGTGIDPELRDRIFEPFFTTKKEGQGTGLGLATVYGIVEQSGGTIAVDSELEKGTTFRIYLPRAVDAEGAFSQPERRAEIVGGTETVLLVEDDRMVRSRMENTLEANGYRVLSAENGEKALETARRAHPTSIQLLLTDVMMPGIGGIELAAQLRQARPGLRVLFISGYAQDGIGEGALDERTRLLQKPFTSRDLLMAVRGALEAPSLETP